MSCCDGWNLWEDYPKDYKCKQCPDCGEDVDDDGTAMIGFWFKYSPVECKTCGSAPKLLKSA
jgi:hypothetical protein